MLTQIVRLKHIIVNRLKDRTLKRCSTFSRSSSSSSDSDEPGTARRRTPSGYVAVYVGPERRRFIVPIRFLNLPVFVALLDQAEEEFGFQAGGGLALPCEIGFFQYVLRCLEESEARFRSTGLGEFEKMASKVDLESDDFTPLLNDVRV